MQPFLKRGGYSGPVKGRGGAFHGDSGAAEPFWKVFLGIEVLN